MKDKDIPHCMTIQGGVIKAWKVHFETLQKEMQVSMMRPIAYLYNNSFFFCSRIHWGIYLLLWTSGLEMIGDRILHSPHTGLPTFEMGLLNFIWVCQDSTTSLGHTQVIASAQHCWACSTERPSPQRYFCITIHTTLTWLLLSTDWPFHCWWCPEQHYNAVGPSASTGIMWYWVQFNGALYQVWHWDIELMHLTFPCTDASHTSWT